MKQDLNINFGATGVQSTEAAFKRVQSAMEKTSAAARGKSVDPYSLKAVSQAGEQMSKVGMLIRGGGVLAVVTASATAIRKAAEAYEQYATGAMRGWQATKEFARGLADSLPIIREGAAAGEAIGKSLLASGYNKYVKDSNRSQAEKSVRDEAGQQLLKMRQEAAGDMASPDDKIRNKYNPQIAEATRLRSSYGYFLRGVWVLPESLKKNYDDATDLIKHLEAQRDNDLANEARKRRIDWGGMFTDAKRAAGGIVGGAASAVVAAGQQGNEATMSAASRIRQLQIDEFRLRGEAGDDEAKKMARTLELTQQRIDEEQTLNKIIEDRSVSEETRNRALQQRNQLGRKFATMRELDKYSGTAYQLAGAQDYRLTTSATLKSQQNSTAEAALKTTADNTTASNKTLTEMLTALKALANNVTGAKVWN